MIGRLLSAVPHLFKNRERNILIAFQFFNALLSVVFGKLVALYIDPETFGKFNIQNAVYFFVFSLLFQPFIQYIKANFFQIKTNAAAAHLIKFYLGFLLLAIILIVGLFKFYFQEDFWVIAMIIVTLILHSLFMLVNDYYALEAKFIKISILHFYKNMLPILLLILFVFMVGFTPDKGYHILWAAQIAGFIVAAYRIIKSSPFIRIPNPELRIGKLFADVLKYTGPLYFLSFWNWMNTYADRFIIEKHLGLEVLGIYNANVGLGSKVFLMLNPLFLTMLTPVIFNTAVSLEERKSKINFYLKIYMLLIIFAGIGVYVFGDLIGRIFLSAEYQDGFYLIFWSCVSYGIITAGYLLEMIFYAGNKTKIVLFANVISAAVVVSANFLLIPIFGLPAAAFALIAASVVKFIYLRFTYALTI